MKKRRKLVGIVTDGDLRRSLKKYSPNDWSDLKALDLMTGGYLYLSRYFSSRRIKKNGEQ